MPNWCQNEVKLSHNNPAMLERAQKAFENGKLLNEFIPVPEELRNTTSGFYGEGIPEQKEIEAIHQANVEKYGYADWYDFTKAKWGTKWDIDGSDSELDGDTLCLSFQSAWSPPIAAYDALLGLGFEITAYFYEGGCSFCGKYSGTGEDRTVDDYDIGGDSDWVVANIPREIDEAFAISENMAEWESEEEYED